MRRRLAAAAALAAVVAGGVALWRRSGADGAPVLGAIVDLPPRLPIETVAAELSDAVAATPRPDGVRIGVLAPRKGMLAAAGPRSAVVTPPGTAATLRAVVPPDAVLRFGAGVEWTGARRRDAAGIRLTVRADDRALWSRVVNPAARHDDRVWFDAAVDVGDLAGRTVAFTFAAERVGGAADEGTPGWSQARLVGRMWRDRQPASPDAPNVLVLLVDTLRADRLGCYGAAPTNSPHLDAWAARGIVFAQHVAPAPWTLPSTATLLTGLHPVSHGALGDAGNGLPSQATTLPEVAQAAGITTVGIATNPLVSRGTNLAQGFETFVELDIRTTDEGKTPATADEVNALFEQWLDRNGRHRFLAYLHYMDPHAPYTPPAHLRPPTPPGLRPLVAAGRIDQWQEAIHSAEGLSVPPAELAHLRRLYDAEVRSWDEALGRLLDVLRARDRLRDTVVVVTADHGEAFQEHGRLTHGFHLYDELLRVPLVIVGPGVPARREARQTSGVDVFPTLAALLGVAPPAGLPGTDVLRLDADRPVFSTAFAGRLADRTGADLVAVRTPSAKLVWAPALGRYELYDLRTDPGETVDRWTSAPDAAALAAVLAAWRRGTPTAAARAVDPAFRERLRALGYAE